jgi:hypothetical protein
MIFSSGSLQRSCSRPLVRARSNTSIDWLELGRDVFEGPRGRPAHSGCAPMRASVAITRRGSPRSFHTTLGEIGIMNIMLVSVRYE